ncbi:MAG TPA: hypothetical protein VN836_11125 [Verrucomicrobiae bacterium]|nr:hypothetical protein [Verrucomicrobiae bacterium]
MFDLEQAIADWRRQMLAAGIETPVPLDELECHLREDVEEEVRSGINAQKAFEAAVQRIGQANVLKSEFKKVERSFMKKILIILIGIFGVLAGTGFILPALAKYKEQGTMVHDATLGLLIGIPIVLGGIGTAFYGFKKRKA